MALVVGDRVVTLGIDQVFGTSPHLLHSGGRIVSSRVQSGDLDNLLWTDGALLCLSGSCGALLPLITHIGVAATSETEKLCWRHETS